MENISGSTHDDDTGLLVVNSSPRSGRDAATQTPQLVRHTTQSRRPSSQALSLVSSSSGESVAYEDSITYPPSVVNLEVSRDMSIPDLIIDKGKDTSFLTQEAFNTTPQEQLSGITNLAFGSKDEKVRSSSIGSFRQLASAYHPSSPTSYQPSEHLFMPNNPLDSLKPSAEKFNRRFYSSLPKTPSGKHQDKNLQLRIQPPSFQVEGSKEVAIGMDNTDFWIIPREHSSLNSISAQASKYSPAEGIAGLYAISGRSAMASNGFPDPVIGLYEMNLLPPVDTRAHSTPISLKKFELTKMPASVDRQRRRRQWCTDSLSCLLILTGLLIAGITPLTIIPLFYVGMEHLFLYSVIFLSSGTLAVVVLVFGGLTGNIVWWYDESSKKLKPRLHCGNGPTSFFWGNAFYYFTEEREQKELV